MCAGAFWVVFALYNSFHIPYLQQPGKTNRRSVFTTLLRGSEGYHLVAGSFPQSYTHFTASPPPSEQRLNLTSPKYHRWEWKFSKDTLGHLPVYFTVETMGPKRLKCSWKSHAGRRKHWSPGGSQKEFVSLRPCKIAWRWDKEGGKGHTMTNQTACLLMHTSCLLFKLYPNR